VIEGQRSAVSTATLVIEYFAFCLSNQFRSSSSQTFEFDPVARSTVWGPFRKQEKADSRACEAQIANYCRT
jgi:hypothetical protein